MIHPTPGTIAIQSFEERYAGNFEKLNRIWLENYNLLEESNLPYLNSPYESIIAPGGQIFFAIDNWQVIGTERGLNTMVDLRSEQRKVEVERRKHPRLELHCDATVLGLE